MTKSPPLLTPRWTPMRPHIIQGRYVSSPHRFNVVPAGRRSGKTEIAKRKLILRASVPGRFGPARYFAGAPTRDQAKRIFWNDLKALTPEWMLAKKPSESELVLPFINGSEIHVVGLDVPARLEGSPWDGGILDEYGNMKSDAWNAHVRPSLSDRRGWCDFIGVPEGRNHYYNLYKRARADVSGAWGAYHWISADILPPEEIRQAKQDLDELTYKQEYEASFVSFLGRAYYNYSEANEMKDLPYAPEQHLIFCFDFNVSPGTASVWQDWDVASFRKYYNTPASNFPRTGTVSLCIGEVWIPRNSSTEMVCNRLVEDWGGHTGKIVIYGDATGGARKTSQIHGTDWDIIRNVLTAHFRRDQVIFRVPRSNPPERSRVNAVNSRIRSISGNLRLFVDVSKAPHVAEDFDRVEVVAGSAGEIDKKTSPQLTHLSDGAGYYIHYEYPVVSESKTIKITGV